MNKRKNKNYWTKEKCKKEALKYRSRSVFKRQSPGAFGSAYKNKWINEICSHMKKVGNRFNRLVYVYIFNDNFVYVGLTHDVEERDNKHKRDKRSAVYKHIKKTNIIPKLIFTNYMNINEAILHEISTVEKYKKLGYNILNVAKAGSVGGAILKWTFDKCKKEALQYKTRTEFYKNNNSAYNSARRYGWIDEICSHMNKNRRLEKGYWTKEKCLEEIKKYSSRNEFSTKSPGAYGAVIRNGWLEDVCDGMKTKKPNGYWTKEKCLEEVLKYKTKKSFRIGNNSVYSLMIRKGWFNEVKNLK